MLDIITIAVVGAGLVLALEEIAKKSKPVKVKVPANRRQNK